MMGERRVRQDALFYEFSLERHVPDLPKVVILRLRNMTAIDGTGLHALEHFADALHVQH